MQLSRFDLNNFYNQYIQKIYKYLYISMMFDLQEQVDVEVKIFLVLKVEYKFGFGLDWKLDIKSVYSVFCLLVLSLMNVYDFND